MVFIIPGIEAEAVVAGLESACALRAGQIRCWGNTQHGRLGHGEDVDRAQPTPVAVLDLP